MRTYLDLAYRACGALAGVFLALIAVCVLAQIVGRMFGILVPGADQIAGHCLAATSFLALAYTLRAGEHIRVTLLLRHLAPGRRRVAELWCLGVGTLIAGYFTFYAIQMTLESYEFGDRAVGVLPTPLWIPQIAVSLGLAMLSLALLEEFVTVLRGGRPTYGVRETPDPARGE